MGSKLIEQFFFYWKIGKWMEDKLKFYFATPLWGHEDSRRYPFSGFPSQKRVEFVHRKPHHDLDLCLLEVAVCFVSCRGTPKIQTPFSLLEAEFLHENKMWLWTVELLSFILIFITALFYLCCFLRYRSLFPIIVG